MANETLFHERRSSIDASVNLVRPHPDGGMQEARFVQRDPSRFIVYVSSMTGCDRACRFCHLTQTGQVTSTLLSRDEIVRQAEAVLSLPDARKAAAAASTVHFNFMARGEPLANQQVDAELFAQLARLAGELGLRARMKVSTIMPVEADERRLAALWEEGGSPVDLYYSLYSVDPAWRRRWLPKARDPGEALVTLARWRKATANRVILHWALIDGENDGLEDAERVAAKAACAGLAFDFNLVRYNPANAKSREASRERMDAYLSAMRAAVDGTGRVREIPRVGFDVAASCGMFLEPEEA